MTSAKELLEQATPLPWRYDPEREEVMAEGDDVYVTMDHEGILPSVHEPDAALIVYAVNRLPDYEAAVDALEFFLSVVARRANPEWPASVEEGRVALARLRGES